MCKLTNWYGINAKRKDCVSMRKKIVFWILMGLFSLLIAGCGNKTTPLPSLKDKETNISSSVSYSNTDQISDDDNYIIEYDGDSFEVEDTFYDIPGYEEALEKEITEKTLKDGYIRISNKHRKIENKITKGKAINYRNLNKVLDAIEDNLEKELSNGKIIYYERNENSCAYITSDGIPVIYQPEIEGLAASLSSENLSVSVIEPFDSEMRGYFGDESDLADETAKNITAKFDNLTLVNNLDDRDVNFYSIADIFKPNSIILWFGHGAYGYGQSWLLTGTQIDKDDVALRTMLRYQYKGQFVLSEDGHICIGAKFIKENVESLENSMVFMAACESAKANSNLRLFNALTDKGAAVAGATETMWAGYANRMLSSVVEYMTKVDVTTGNYYTFDKALVISMLAHGKNDNEWLIKIGEELDDGHTAARFVISKPDYSFFPKKEKIEPFTYQGNIVWDGTGSRNRINKPVSRNVYYQVVRIGDRLIDYRDNKLKFGDRKIKLLYDFFQDDVVRSGYNRYHIGGAGIYEKDAMHILPIDHEGKHAFDVYLRADENDIEIDALTVMEIVPDFSNSWVRDNVEILKEFVINDLETAEEDEYQRITIGCKIKNILHSSSMGFYDVIYTDMDSEEKKITLPENTFIIYNEEFMGKHYKNTLKEFYENNTQASGALKGTWRGLWYARIYTEFGDFYIEEESQAG